MRPTRAPSIHRVALAPRLGARLALRPPRAAPREDNDQPVDIDALAAALAAAAGARRAAGESVDAEEEEDVASGDEPSPPPRASTPFDVASASTRAAEVFAEHPDTGFDPDTIELLQELGRVSWSEDGGEAGPTVAAVAYAARYTPAAPFQSPTFVLVKEYAPSATSLAANEVQVGVRLSAGGRLPGNKWHAATGRGTPAPRPPAVPLLGYFQAAPAAVLDGSDDSDGDDDSAAATWLVFKWEGLQPLSFYAAADQPPPAGLAALLPRDTTASDRTRMLRAVLAGAAAALARVHAAGVAHGSLGGGCVLLSSYTDAEWRRVTVTLDNFGFAQMRRGGGEDGGRGADDDPVALAQAADARALARLAVETLLAALGERGAGDPTIRPLAKDVVRAAEEGGGTAARAVVAGAPAFARAAAALDADDGWGVVAALAHGARLSEVVASEWVVRADRG